MPFFVCIFLWIRSVGTAGKLRDQVKDAFALPGSSHVLDSTLSYVSGTVFDTTDVDSFAPVSTRFEQVMFLASDGLDEGAQANGKLC